MARSRNIKPGFAKNEFLAQRSMPARLLFALLPTLADREGRLEDRPIRIKGELFPYEQVDVDSLLSELSEVRDGEDHPFLIRYRVSGCAYIQIVKFLDNQNPHKDERPSVIPPCEYGATTIQPPCEHDASTKPALDAGLRESEKRESEKRESEKRESEKRESEKRESENVTVGFENFWSAVHRKVGKRAAEREYIRAVKRLVVERPGEDPHMYLLDRMTEFAASPQADPKDHTPIHPSTWLSHGRYEDDPNTWKSRAKSNGEHFPTTAELMGRST